MPLTAEGAAAFHPPTGLPEQDAFPLAPGRLCVLLPRPRQACLVVGREGDALLGDQPSTLAYLGWNPDPVLEGWEPYVR